MAPSMRVDDAAEDERGSLVILAIENVVDIPGGLSVLRNARALSLAKRDKYCVAVLPIQRTAAGGCYECPARAMARRYCLPPCTETGWSNTAGLTRLATKRVSLRYTTDEEED